MRAPSHSLRAMRKFAAACPLNYESTSQMVAPGGVGRRDRHRLAGWRVTPGSNPSRSYVFGAAFGAGIRQAGGGVAFQRFDFAELQASMRSRLPSEKIRLLGMNIFCGRSIVGEFAMDGIFARAIRIRNVIAEPAEFESGAEWRGAMESGAVAAASEDQCAGRVAGGLQRRPRFRDAGESFDADQRR